MSEFIPESVISSVQITERKVLTNQCCNAHQQSHNLRCKHICKYWAVCQRIYRITDCQLSEHAVRIWSDWTWQEELWLDRLYDGAWSFVKLHSYSEQNKFSCAVLLSNDSDS